MTPTEEYLMTPICGGYLEDEGEIVSQADIEEGDE